MLYMKTGSTKRARFDGADRVADADASVAEARRGFADIIERAQQGAAIHITRHKEPVAVLLSAKAYKALTERRPSFADAVRRWRAQHAETLDDSFAEAVTKARDRSPGREFSF